MNKQEELAKLKKANKERKLKMAVKAGFATVKSYIAYLTDIRVVKPVIHVVDIVDTSYSMNGGKIRAANNGITTQVNELKMSDEAFYKYTLVKFSCNYHITTVVDKTEIAKVKLPHLHAGGNTALYQAVGETLEKMEEVVKEGELVLVKIYTDGEENDSIGKYRTASILKKYIEKLKEKGWTITFIGTERDVASVVRNLSIESSNTLSYDGTVDGFEQSMRTASVATKSYAMKASRGEDVKTEFFSKKSGKL